MKANATPVFTKKWWEDNCSRAVKKGEMGKALAEWETSCPVQTKQIGDSIAFQAAYDACAAVKKGIAWAEGKCDQKKQKETLDCLVKYEKELGDYKKALDTEQVKRVEAFRAARQKLIEYTEDSLAEMTKGLDQMKIVVNGAESAMTTAEKRMEEGDTDNAKKAAQEAQNFVVTAEEILDKLQKKYDLDGPHIKEERSNKGDPKAFGALKGADKYKNLINTVVRNGTSCGEILNEAKDYVKAIKESAADAQAAASGTSKSVESCAELATATKAEIGELIKQIEDDAGKAQNTFKMLEGPIKANKPLPQDMVDGMAMSVESAEIKINQFFGQIQRKYNAAEKRIPKPIKDNRAFKPTMDQLKMSMMASIKDVQAFRTQANKLKADIGKIPIAQ